MPGVFAIKIINGYIYIYYQQRTPPPFCLINDKISVHIQYHNNEVTPDF